MKTILPGIAAMMIAMLACEISADIQDVSPQPLMVNAQTARPGIYMVTFKDSFMQPFSEIYTGSRTTRGARAEGAQAYRRTVQARIMAALRNTDGSPIVAPDSIHYFYSNLVVGFAASLNETVIRKLSQDTNIAIIERQEEEYVLMGETANSAAFGAHVAEHMDLARDQIGYKSAPANKIAWILDTGIDLDHPDLYVNKGLSDVFTSGLTSPDDDNGHGTNVAGILGAKKNGVGAIGVAAGAELAAVKVVDKSGYTSPFRITKGLEYIWEYSIEGDVINFSIATEVAANGVDAMETAVKAFYGWKIYIALAAGNDMTTASSYSPQRLSMPTNAFAPKNNFIRVISAYRIGYGFCVKFKGFATQGSNYGVAIDYAAPGEDIHTTAKGGGYTEKALGTSMAAPTAAGIMLLNNGYIYSHQKVTFDPDPNPDRVVSID